MSTTIYDALSNFVYHLTQVRTLDTDVYILILEWHALKLVGDWRAAGRPDIGYTNVAETPNLRSTVFGFCIGMCGMSHSILCPHRTKDINGKCLLNLAGITRPLPLCLMNLHPTQPLRSPSRAWPTMSTFWQRNECYCVLFVSRTLHLSPNTAPRLSNLSLTYRQINSPQAGSTRFA